jgi:hypothetical protein
MLRTVAVSIVMLVGLMLAGAPAMAVEPVTPVKTTVSPILAKFAPLWSGKDADATKRRTIPVAACTMDCCCQYFEGGGMKNQCKSRDDCIAAGGICKSKTDAKCN